MKKRLISALLVLVLAICVFPVSAFATTNEYICARADLHNYPYGLTQHNQHFTMTYHTEVLIRSVGDGTKIGQLDKDDSGIVIYPNDVYYNDMYWSSVSANGVQGISASYYLH